MKVLGIDNVLFGVGELAQAIEFYGSRVGLPVKFELAGAGIAAFRIGREEPGLLVRAKPAEPRVWFEVQDARQFADELGQRGVELLARPFEVHTGWAFEIADPWGNVIGFTDYLKAPTRAPTRARKAD